MRLRSRLAAVLAAAGIALLGAAAPAAASPPITPVIHYCYYAPQVCLDYGNGTFTAWAFYDVGPTPYAYVIWNVTLRDEMRLCGFGSSCSVSPGPNLYPPPGRCYAYAAYIGAGTNLLPPSTTIARSSLLTLCA
jgi:hypothetical protein